MTPADFDRPIVLDIWNLHYMKADQFLEDKRYFMDQIDPADLEPQSARRANADSELGLDRLGRQLLQLEKASNRNSTPYLDLDGLDEILPFTYPLNFIDFETTRVAIPFHKGRRPYENLAFQFSHHLLHKDGRVEHKTQYLCFERGKFPNFEFVRKLKDALEKNGGTIFRYADHENTVLREIHAQLEIDDSTSDVPKDAAELRAWIDSVTRYKEGNAREFTIGPRCMVDLRKLVEKYFYHPSTRGSNSIKAVLPAVLNESTFLQERYSAPIYGAESGDPKNKIVSLNFKNQVWIKTNADGSVKDPYKLLPSIFTDVTLPDGSLYEEDDRIAEGGAAMTAYNRMQYTEMPESERLRVAEALYRYCELDTLAMVMIYQYWNHELELRKRKAA